MNRLTRTLAIAINVVALGAISAAANASSQGQTTVVRPEAAQSDVAVKRSGSLSCKNWGLVTPTVTYNQYLGVRVAVKKAGPPTSPTWGKRKKIYHGIDADKNFAFVSPWSSGRWSASSLRGNGPSAEWGQCTRRPLPSGRPKATRKLGKKTCPAGQSVVIQADGWGQHWILWQAKSGQKSHRVKFPSSGPGTLMQLNGVDTGRRSLYSSSVRAYRGSEELTPERWIEGPTLRCSKEAGIVRE